MQYTQIREDEAPIKKMGDRFPERHAVPGFSSGFLREFSLPELGPFPGCVALRFGMMALPENLKLFNTVEHFSLSS